MATLDDLLVRGFQARQQDLPEDALVCFEQALAQAPADMAIRLEVARTHCDLAQPGEARAHLGRIRVSPDASDDDAELAMELARLWVQAGEPGRALRLYRSIPRGQHLPQAVLEAVLLLERTHRLDEARAELARHPNTKATRQPDPTAALAHAVLDERAGDRQTAAARLSRVFNALPPSGLTLECGYRLARLLDAQDRGEEAMDILARCKQAERTQLPGAVLEKHIAARRASDLAVMRELPADWFDSRPDVGNAPRAVVLGHPRSGTSLFSRHLCRAGQADWIDECPAFSVLARRLVARSAEADQTFVEFLGGLDKSEIDQFESQYTHQLQDHLPPDAASPMRRLIDKNPGLSNSLPALHRMLPNSAWVYLQRDPRDIAISCYFQRLGASPLGWACMTLQGAVDAVMHTVALWDSIRGQLAEEQAVVVRYEDLATNPEQVVSETAARLGWATSSTGGTAVASEPVIVHSPTYAAVRRTIDTQAVGRWHRHADRLVGLKPEHRELIERLGYLD